MKTRLAQLFRWLAVWFGRQADRLDPPAYVPEPEVSTQLAAARLLVREWRSKPVSGEYKRHQVYAALLDRFPSSSKRFLSRTLEQAVQEL
jgi:hypothetical protein